MHEIRLLPSDIINEIAAGEVIERPVSVVKELVENSIDALADKISISIEDGGLLAINVSDNGIGIDKKYMEMSVKRHATSKLKKKSLDGINTLGFRGEALNAIANASDFNMISRSRNMSEAYKISMSYGDLVETSPSKGNFGTSITIKRLFKNLPVRKKFLKSENVETLAIKNFIKKISLAYPSITFTFSVGTKEKLYLLGRKNINNLVERIREIYGENFYKSSFYIEKKYPDLQIKIYASIPTYNKANWQTTTIVINGRVIKDRLFLGVIKAAYAGLLAGNRFPVVVLFINTNSSNLDINVHPTKSEVRILNRSIVNSKIIKNIREQLGKIGLKHSVEVEKSFINNIYKNNELRFNHIRENINIQNDESVYQEEMEKFKSEDKSSNKRENRLGFAKAQINNMFIVAQTVDSLILIDQHAAHERIVLENLKKNFYNNKIIKQALLIPEVIEIESDKSLFFKNKIAINQLGFIFDDYGDNSIIVREIPAILGKINISLLFQDLNEQINRIGEINPLDSSIEKIFSSIACHNSVRAGRKLNLEEMNSILRLMEDTPNSGQCNHGRPTYIELKLKDVEKLFGRI